MWGALFAGPPPPPQGGPAKSARRRRRKKNIVFFVKMLACPSATAYLRWWLVVVGRLMQKKLANSEFRLKIKAIYTWKLRIPHKSYDFMWSCGGVWCKVLRNFHVYIDLGEWGFYEKSSIRISKLRKLRFSIEIIAICTWKCESPISPMTSC